MAKPLLPGYYRANALLGGRIAQLGTADFGRYSVENLLELTGARFELVTGVLAEEGIALRRRWMEERMRKGLPLR